LNKNALELRRQFDVIFENQYGSVELHVIAVAATQRGDDFDSTGKPIANNNAYILINTFPPVPTG